MVITREIGITETLKWDEALKLGIGDARGGLSCESRIAAGWVGGLQTRKERSGILKFQTIGQPGCYRPSLSLISSFFVVFFLFQQIRNLARGPFAHARLRVLIKLLQNANLLLDPSAGLIR